MHEAVVVQPLSAITRRNSPNPASSAAVHSTFLMRQGPGSICPNTFGGIMATTGEVAIAVAGVSFFLTVAQPDNATASAATRTSVFTLCPLPNRPVEILGGTQASDNRAIRCTDALIREHAPSGA